MCMPRSGAGAGLSPRPRLYRRMSVLLSGTPTLPTLLRRIPARFCRRPHLRLRQADTRIPRRHPPPRPRLRDTHTLSAGSPHPARACGAPPPPPLGGGVRAWRYLVGSRIRLFSRISPCCGPCGYRHGGWGRRGGGTRSPSPVSHAPEIPHISSAPPMPSAAGYPHASAGSPTPPAPSQGYPYPSAGIPRPTRAFGAPPPPRRGGGSAHDIRGTAVPGVEPTGSRALDRGDIAFGGEADGEGELVPPPLSPTLQLSYFSSPPLPRLRRGIPRHFCRHLPYPRLRRSSPAPSRSRAVPGRISGEQPYPGCSRWKAVHWAVVAITIGGQHHWGTELSKD